MVQLPVAAISLDFTRGKNLELMKTYGWSQDKRLGAGVVYALNIWRIRPQQVFSLLEELQGIAPNLAMQPSASLQFLPYDATREQKLPEALRDVLSFAEQKLTEITLLAQTLAGEDTKAVQEQLEEYWRAFYQFSPV